MERRCLEIKSYCSCSLNHNNEFGLTRSINYSGLESNRIIHIRWVRGEFRAGRQSKVDERLVPPKLYYLQVTCLPVPGMPLA